ncbi:MAG: carboxymuconolactone decarboxylase family protein [Proteobacteria bacterium]|nr:carboxymuconolactone decarboxylase family protein [Pseudomonadota bacterium]
MPRIEPLNRPAGRSEALLDQVRTAMGFVPALMHVLAHSPAALAGYLSLRDALSHGVLPLRLREQVAIAIAAGNNCNVCLASHTRYGRAAGLTADEVAAAQRATSADRMSASALDFARLLLDGRGHVPDADIAAIYAAGFDDAAIVEIAAAVALNTFANMVNNLAHDRTDAQPDAAAQIGPFKAHNCS